MQVWTSTQLVSQRRPWVVAGRRRSPLGALRRDRRRARQRARRERRGGAGGGDRRGAATGIRAAGLVAAVSSAAWFDFFLTQPYRSFAIDSAEDVEVALLLLVVGIAVTELALWGQRQRADLGRQRGYLDGVMATAESVARDADLAHRDRVPSRTGSARCSTSTGVSSWRAALLPGGPMLERDGTVTRGGGSLDVDRGGLPVDRVVVLPVRVADPCARGYFAAHGGFARGAADTRPATRRGPARRPGGPRHGSGHPGSHPVTGSPRSR